MKEPRRWSEPGNAPNPEVARLLAAAVPSRPLTRPEYARTWRSLRKLVALPAAAGFMLWVKGGIAALALGVSTTATYYVVENVARQQPDRPAVSTPAVVPVPPPSAGLRETASALDAGALDAAPADNDAGADVLEASAPRTVAPAASSADSLEAEAALLARARGAAHANPDEALRLLREHARRYPRGKLVMERHMVEIEVLANAGRTQEARARAEALLARSQGSLYEARLRRMLERMP